jgi:hypothetical protein
MKRLFAILLASSLAVSCAHEVPGYKPSRAACSGPIPEKGMRSRSPSAEDVQSAWSLLDLKQGEIIEGWFEDRVGNIALGVTGNTQHWQASLVRAGEYLRLTDHDWRQSEIVCVG